MFQNTPLFFMFGLLVVAYFISCAGQRLITWFVLSVFSIIYVLYSSGRVGGVDTPLYRVMFGDDEGCARFEYGFYQLCRLDSTSGFSFTFLLSSVLLLFVIYRISENSRVFAVAALILFPLYFVIVDMGYLRQSLATSILYLFCVNQERRGVRLIGYVMALFFHIPSLALIFFFELLYSKKKIQFSLVLSALLLITVTVWMVLKWIDMELIGLFAKSFSLNSIVQLIFLLTLNAIAAIQFKWKARVTVFVTLVCIAGYLGHFYRVYLFLVPIVAVGVAHYVVKRRISVRLWTLVILTIFGFSKLSASIDEFDGAFDIPYSENLLFWFT